VQISPVLYTHALLLTEGDRGTWTVPGKSPRALCGVHVNRATLPLESGRVTGHRDAGFERGPESEPGSNFFHGHVLLFEISLPPVHFWSDRDLRR
jgi:hypothetical protein